MTLDVRALRAGLDRVGAAMERDFEMLNTADGALGDGDLGVTMTRGMRAIEGDPDWERMQELIDVYDQRFQDVVDAAAHAQHDHRFEIVQVGQTIDHQGGLGRTDTEIDHGAVHFRCVDDAEIPLLDLAAGAFGKCLDILPKVGDQYMAAKIFQLTIGIALQCLPDVFVLFQPHHSPIVCIYALSDD